MPEQISKISPYIQQEVLVTTAQRIGVDAGVMIEKPQVEWQRAAGLFNCGKVVIAEDKKDKHPTLWAVHNKEHIERNEKPDLSMISGEVFKIKNSDDTYIRLDRQITLEEAELIEKLGYVPLQPNFYVVKSNQDK